MSVAQEQRIETTAARLIEAARREPGSDPLLQQVSLDSPEGLALLSLAEALLRIPDTDNAERLIRDQLARLAGRLPSSAGILTAVLRLIATAMVDRSASASTFGRWRQSVRRGLMPVLRIGMRHCVQALGGRFIFAARIEAAIARAGRAEPSASRYSFDMLGEAALNAQDAERYYAAYEHAIHVLGRARKWPDGADQSISVKLSALHPRYEYARHGGVMRELGPRLRQLALLAQRYRIALSIDAEEAERLELSLDLIESLATDAALADWPGLGVAVQAYQKRATAVIEYLAALAARRDGPIAVRLVKGAYWDAEIKRAQLQGLVGYPVYTRKAYTDVAYRVCARQLLRAWPRLQPQFATHNARTVAEVLELSRDSSIPIEFQRLFGMGRALYRALSRRADLARPVRVYAPVGERAQLLPYLMRRLLENGASSSFVHRAASVPVAALCADPLAAALRSGGAPHPRIPLPAQLFAPLRRNSAGMDLEDRATRERLQRALETSARTPIEVRPLIGAAASTSSQARPIRNPADRSELVGNVHEADDACVQAALQVAQSGSRQWALAAVETRARLLERAAELFEQRAPELIALIVREAGRTLACGIDEVREAVDALRYYAAQIRVEFDECTHVPLGIVACISPWNFPLAIFTGQIAAALAAGNAVIAKPAEQTAATAALATSLLHQAGIGKQVLQLLPGEGPRIGLQLVCDSRVQGVVFTGSSATARTIARALAPRGTVPLIAETGGQNAMIVDSSALPEQVVSDALRSAFDSAGQRCSALRVLCLQNEIAAPVLTMLEGAMRELRIGNPADISTDVGPLIDAAAQARIRAYLDSTTARVRCCAPMPQSAELGVFLAPTLLEIERIADLKAEVFGPVLHVVRFERRELDRLLDDLNETGYGLTLGIASRIPSTIDHIVERARVGNVYVNRNMIGAVIGAQPFGGQGLSGTGPKAGGPLYVHALLARTPGPRWTASASGSAGNPGLAALIAWLQQGGGTLRAREREQLRLRAQRYAERSPWGMRLALPGPVGEHNQLSLRSRGVLAATAHSPAALLDQLAAALATGNAVRVDQEPLAAALRAELPRAAQVAMASGTPTWPACEAVLVDEAEAEAQPEWVQQLRVALGGAEGPIVPLLIGHAPEGYALERLLVEQSVSINTAAVGGDVELLGLRDL